MKVGDIDTEELVFEKTKSLLLKYGVKGWNMNDLAKECSMSKRTLYKIIGNKEDLLTALSRNGISKSIARMERYLLSEQPFPQLLHHLSDHIIDGFDDYNLGQIRAVRVEYPSIREMEYTFLEKQREFIINFFEKGKNEGVIVDYASGSAIEKTLHALIEYHITTCNNKTEFKNEMSEVLTVFLKGVMK